MPSAFAAEVLDATAAIDAEMAETFTVIPMATPKDTTASIAADGTRIASNFQAQYFDPLAPAGKPMPDAWDTRSQHRLAVESGKPRIEISTYELARTGVLVRKPDMVVRRGTGLLYEVEASPITTQGGRRVLWLTYKGPAAADGAVLATLAALPLVVATP